MSLLSRFRDITVPPLLKRLLISFVVLQVISLVLIAIIAIPNLLRSRSTANEAAAVGTLRILNNALTDYRERYDQFPTSLVALGPGAGGNASAEAAGLVASVFVSGEKSGYRFAYQSFDANRDGRLDAYSIQASPVTPGTTGDWHFFTDQTAAIRGEKEHPATAQSPPI